jgi:hypothetical protein
VVGVSSMMFVTIASFHSKAMGLIYWVINTL